MFWQRIVAGVDASPAGAGAARRAWKLAQVSGAEFDLVHATVDVSAVPATLETDIDLEALMDHVTAAARKEVEEELRGNVPPEALDRLDIVMGKPGWTLPREVRRRDADLLVLGGKHHSRLGRWLGGSLAHYAVRKVDVPTFVTTPRNPTIERVVVGVDLSDAAAATLNAGKYVAELFDAALRVVHAIEPLPSTYPVYPWGLDTYRRYAKEHFNDMMDAIEGNGWIQRAIREGPAARVLADEAAEWDADLLVVGSHGKGFIDRMLLGSTTQRLLYHLPTSLLVVPVGVTSSKTTIQEQEQKNLQQLILA